MKADMYSYGSLEITTVTISQRRTQQNHQSLWSQLFLTRVASWWSKMIRGLQSLWILSKDGFQQQWTITIINNTSRHIVIQLTVHTAQQTSSMTVNNSITCISWRTGAVSWTWILHLNNAINLNIHCTMYTCNCEIQQLSKTTLADITYMWSVFVCRKALQSCCTNAAFGLADKTRCTSAIIRGW